MPMLTTSVIAWPVAPLPRRSARRRRKRAIGAEHGVDLRHHVRAVDQHRRALGTVAQRRVQHGAVLGHVDRLAAEHRVAAFFRRRRLRPAASNSHRSCRSPRSS